VARELRAGPSTLEGLRWLASVGPAPIEAWSAAMGWGRSTAFSHAARLRSEGWAASCAMTAGSGSLLYATRAGVRVAGVAASPVTRPPSAATWAHCQGCAWTAAWLSARGRRVLGTRELLLDDSWRGELQWVEREGVRRRGHRPDLAAGFAEGPLLPIEVELAGKTKARLRAVLGLHAAWIAASRAPAVIYVCGSRAVAERVREQAAEVGLAVERKTLRVELLDRIQTEAIAARKAVVAA
jgi:hypothetical protein